MGLIGSGTTKTTYQVVSVVIFILFSAGVCLALQAKVTVARCAL